MSTNSGTSAPNRRLLVIDDNIAIHEDVRKILCPTVSENANALAELEQELLGDNDTPPVRKEALNFQVDSAHQGREGLALVERAVAEGRPYAMAFVDVRMPPGWDGIETTVALWRVQPDLQIVICTAYSDYSWDEMLNRVGRSDRLVVLRKPFDTIEVLQLASALTEKWNLVQERNRHEAELEQRVRERTADLQAANVALQDEIARRVAVETDLVRAKEVAESADRAKSAFLANMSHEIRTPMNGVIGMANLLVSTPLNSEQHDYVQTLSQCSDSLLTIINDILDFSKIEAGRLELEVIDFDLAEAIQLTLDLQTDAAARKSLELILDIDPSVPNLVRGDPTRLRQVLLNLIGNAVKFTPRGEIIVRVAAVAGGAAGRTRLRFEIRDTGVGIAEDVQSTLFQPFVQADSSTTRRYGGTGLGLAICKRLVELMHGDIGVTSKPGAGSQFWFNVELETAVEDNTVAFLPFPLAGRNILAVDDSPGTRQLIYGLLERWGARPSVAASATAALAEIRRAALAGAPYTVILLDHHMPETGGLQLAQAIRAEPLFRHPALVLLTSRNERLNAEQLEAHGIDACEVKPIYAEKLRSAIGHLLTRSRPASLANHEGTATLRHALPVLVAEDNRVNQKVITLMLRNLGLTSEIANNGREALEALREREFALVLMDEHMPELDGIEATRQIRAEASAGLLAGGRNIKIIATTADAMPGTRQRCIEAGMDDYLAKPIRAEALNAMLSSYLKPVAEPLRACVGE